MSDTNTKRRRRILGLPVPVVAALMALMVGGVAWAAIMFHGRITAEREVTAIPTVKWMGPTLKVSGQDGADCQILSGTTNSTDTLQLKVTGYPGGSVEVAGLMDLSADATAGGRFRVVGVDLGEGLEAELLGGTVTGLPAGITYDTPHKAYVVADDVIQMTQYRADLVPVRMKITIPADAAAGSATSANAVGVTLAIVE